MKYIEIGNFAYQLVEADSIQTTIYGYDVETDYCKLTPGGLFTLKKLFSWDGPTGAANTRSFVMSSGYHDALCRLINDELLPTDEQCKADELMDDINERPQVWTDFESPEQSVQMGALRRWYSYVSVRLFQHSKKPGNNYRGKVYGLKLLSQSK